MTKMSKFRKGLSTLLVWALCGFANADTLGVHIGSVHSNHIQQWNNNNPGVYYRHANWVVGTYLNSIGRNSYYGGYVFGIHDNVDFVVGAVSGYRNGAVPIPLVVPSLHWGLGGGMSVRLHAIPKFRKDGAAALHVSLERRF